MKAIVITKPGGPEVLQVQNRADPVPGIGEVLVRVSAAGVNRPDVSQRKGNYPPPPGASQDVPGLEIAGTVARLGHNCVRWKIGDRICALISGGGYAEYVVVPEGQCLPVPDNLSFADAASLPETFFTVWNNVVDRGKLRPGETLLVHGGTSGIGVAAIQLAKALGAKVYTTAGSDEKCAFCEGLGAEKAINYHTQKFQKVLEQLTDNKGVNVVLDMIGGDYTADNLDVLADDGRLVLINFMRGEDVNIKLGIVMRKRLIITGSMLRSRDSKFKSQIAAELERVVWPWLISGLVKPIIFRIYPFGKASEAHRLMESSEHIGKIVLSMDQV